MMITCLKNSTLVLLNSPIESHLNTIKKYLYNQIKMILFKSLNFLKIFPNILGRFQKINGLLKIFLKK
jgi:hypothetical protein